MSTRATSGASEAETRAALGALREARAVAYRPFHDEYRVWEGSDFDLSAALAEAREEQADRRDDASAHGHRMAALTSQLEAAEQSFAGNDNLIVLPADHPLLQALGTLPAPAAEGGD